jgi:uncharacterized protein YjeT (DUF2065 family)
MSFVTTLALVVVVLVALYMVALGAASLLVPDQARRFLLGFAGSSLVHFVELLLRIVAGAALVLYAPNMHFSTTFHLFGWLLLITSACLLLVPWRWHRRFAQHAVPLFTRYLFVIGLVSLSIGAVILFAVSRGNAT